MGSHEINVDGSQDDRDATFIKREFFMKRLNPVNPNHSVDDLQRWQSLSHHQRCKIVGLASSAIAGVIDEFVELSASEIRTDPVNTISAELLPLCSALKWLSRNGSDVLQTRRLGIRGRPFWLFGVSSEVRRVPLGRVLVLGTWNYPLFLSGLQLASSVAAGNETWIKPAPGTTRVLSLFLKILVDCGVPSNVMRLLPEDVSAATDAMDSGMDLVVMTGSAATAKRVMQRCAQTMTPTIIEASGCDAVIAIPGFDERRLIDLLRFGLSLNSGATCIGPRRLLITQSDWDRVASKLRETIGGLPPVTVHHSARQTVGEIVQSSLDRGAKCLIKTPSPFDMQSLLHDGKLAPMIMEAVDESMDIASADIFAPILSVMIVRDSDHAVSIVNGCQYRLAASIIGDTQVAKGIAERLKVGTVIINDHVYPTADPRVPFGGRGQSGFGVTRGAEGLLAFTAIQTVAIRRGSLLPHLRPPAPADRDQLTGLIRFLHANSWKDRWAGLRLLMRRK
jgi:acyl-CoA reductase-like NAD-dependent aldehyde dehydrogenase